MSQYHDMLELPLIIQTFFSLTCPLNTQLVRFKPTTMFTTSFLSLGNQRFAQRSSRGLGRAIGNCRIQLVGGPDGLRDFPARVDKAEPEVLEEVGRGLRTDQSFPGYERWQSDRCSHRKRKFEGK